MNRSSDDVKRALRAAEASWRANKFRKNTDPLKIASKKALEIAREAAKQKASPEQTVHSDIQTQDFPVVGSVQTLRSEDEAEIINSEQEISDTSDSVNGDSISDSEISSETSGDDGMPIDQVQPSNNSKSFAYAPRSSQETQEPDSMNIDNQTLAKQSIQIYEGLQAQLPHILKEDAGLVKLPEYTIDKEGTPAPDSDSQDIKAPAMESLEGLKIRLERTIKMFTEPVLRSPEEVETLIKVVKSLEAQIELAGEEGLSSGLQQEVRRLSSNRKNIRQAITKIERFLPSLSGLPRTSIEKSLAEEKAKLNEVEVAILQKKAELKESGNRRDAIDLVLDEQEAEDFPAGAEKWQKLSEEARVDFELKVAVAFEDYLNSQDPKQFNPTFRRTILTVQQVVPRAATTSRSAAIMVHTNSRSNLVCRLHVISRNYHRDGQVHNGSQIHGIGQPSKSGKKDAPVAAPPGHMHCGCLIDDALIDFYLWKTLKIYSSNPQLQTTNGGPFSEGMGNQVMNPRTRSFFVAVFRLFSGLTVDDLYTGVDSTIEDPEYRTRLLLSQANNFVVLLQQNGVPAMLHLQSHQGEESTEDEEESAEYQHVV